MKEAWKHAFMPLNVEDYTHFEFIEMNGCLLCSSVYNKLKYVHKKTLQINQRHESMLLCLLMLKIVLTLK